LIECMGNNTLASLENLLKVTKFNGFPIVTNRNDMILQGYISRSSLLSAIHYLRHEKGADSISPCTFGNSNDASSHTRMYNLSAWMNATPITVNIHFGTDIIVDLFSRMGMKCLLVVEKGHLKGLITRKDVIRYLEYCQN